MPGCVTNICKISPNIQNFGKLKPSWDAGEIFENMKFGKSYISCLFVWFDREIIFSGFVIKNSVYFNTPLGTYCQTRLATLMPGRSLSLIFYLQIQLCFLLLHHLDIWLGLIIYRWTVNRNGHFIFAGSHHGKIDWRADSCFWFIISEPG